MVDEINGLFSQFLLSGKGNKIQLDFMISECEHSGLKMIDIKLVVQALKVSFEASNRGQSSCRCTLDQWHDLIGVITS